MTKPWVLPSFQCSRCPRIEHAFCGPTIKYCLPKDVFANINQNDLNNFRINCVQRLQANFICSHCWNGKTRELPAEYEDFEGKSIKSVHVKFVKGKYIKITEKLSDKPKPITRTYSTRDEADPVKFDEIPIKQYQPDKNLMKESIDIYEKLSKKKANSSLKPDPKLFAKIFSNNGVPSGGFIIRDGYTQIEKEWMHNELRFMYYKIHSNKLPKWFRKRNGLYDKTRVDWNFKTTRYGCTGSKDWMDWIDADRLKLYFAFWYEYKGNKMVLHTNTLAVDKLPVYKFMKLRNQAVWRDMFEPDMFQINRYNKSAGIGVHSDELVWFPGPVHSTRIGGFAKLHFGLFQQGGTYRYKDKTGPQILKDLFIQLNDGDMFKMSGIIQILYKHGIMKGKQWMSTKSLSCLMRVTNRNAVEKILPRSLV